MRTKINKMADYKSALTSLMRDEYERQAKQLAIKIEFESKKHLSRTLKFATPRGERTNQGFGGATPLIIRSVVKRTNFGATLFIQVQVIDKRTSKLHKIWHTISTGTNNKKASKRFIYKLRKNTRTHVGSLDVDPFAGYTGEYRTMKKGGRLPDIEGRRYYELAIEAVSQDFDEGLFTFLRKEGNENE